MTLTNNTLYAPGVLSFHKYFDLMIACIGRNMSPVFKLIKYNIVVFDEVRILFHFNINYISQIPGTFFFEFHFVFLIKLTLF